MRHEILVGVERRRRWSDDQKISILSEVGVGGAKVADVARRHDLTRQHIYQWRAELRRKGLWPDANGAVFLALEPPAAVPAETSSLSSNASLIEIVLRNGRELRCSDKIGDGDLSRLIRLVETA
jgi:transposase